jgi:hypothetical protein
MMQPSSLLIGNTPVGEEQLWRAVIASTIREWISGPLRRKYEAEEYLFGGGKDFPLVCQSAGIDAGRLRTRLMQLRREGLPTGALLGREFAGCRVPMNR